MIGRAGPGRHGAGRGELARRHRGRLPRPRPRSISPSPPAARDSGDRRAARSGDQRRRLYRRRQGRERARARLRRQSRRAGGPGRGLRRPSARPSSISRPTMSSTAASAAPMSRRIPSIPLSVYGASKEAGEQRHPRPPARPCHPAHLLGLCPAWARISCAPCCGWRASGRSFAWSTTRSAARRRPRRSPAPSQGAAGALLAGGRDFGTFHFCRLRQHELVRLCPRPSSSSPRARARASSPIPTSGYPTPARRPANSVLDSSKFARLYGVTARPWRDSLARCLGGYRERGRRGRHEGHHPGGRVRARGSIPSPMPSASSCCRSTTSR